MATNGGLNIVRDGLVFYYDTGNTKSYKGEPTTNVVTGSISSYSPYNTFIRNGQDFTITMVGGALYLTLQNGTDYNGQTISISGYIFKNGTPHTLPGSRANTYHTLAASTWDFNSTTGYFRIVEICNTSSTWLFHTPSGANAGDIITIKDWQVEIKPHVSAFTNSSRSVTQGLLPLVGNSTLDLSNVSFDSNSKMVFDGTNDDIKVLVNNSKTNITMEGVIYVNLGTIGTYLSNGDDAGGYCIGIGQYFNTTDNQVVALFGGVRWILTGVYYQYTGYHHIVMTLDEYSTVSIYINGTLIGTNSGTAPNNISAGTGFCIGSQWGIRYSNMKCEISKFYNKTLTIQEIQQNYKQYKTRFSIG